MLEKDHNTGVPARAAALNNLARPESGMHHNGSGGKWVVIILVGIGALGNRFGSPEWFLPVVLHPVARSDRKSTRLNSSHVAISYAVFCLKKKITRTIT